MRSLVYQQAEMMVKQDELKALLAMMNGDPKVAAVIVADMSADQREELRGHLEYLLHLVDQEVL